MFYAFLVVACQLIALTFAQYLAVMKVNDSVFNSFPILKTKRLTLRNILPGDAEAIFAMRSNQAVNQFIARDSMLSASDAETLVQKTNDTFAAFKGIGWAGLLREHNTIIGSCGFNQIDYPNLRAELGGELATSYWGKHIALEAAQTIVQFGFEQLELHSIEAKLSPENRGAIHLLECMGFTKEAHFKDRIYFKGKFMDMAVYSVLKSDFKQSI